MTKHSQIFALCVLTAAWGCTDDTPEPVGSSETETEMLSLESDGAGNLRFCPADSDCVVVSNPGQCSVLQVEIEPTSGRSCERCIDESGAVLYERCEETSVACTVVTAPEPDCVVCAHVDGPVIFSSCTPEPPAQCDYYPVDSAADGGTLSCERCYNDEGEMVSDSCGLDCSAVLCAAVDCAEGFSPKVPAGGCCPVCVPDASCDDVPCPDIGYPECEDGTVRVRDPEDCCGYICEPADCSAVVCPAVVRECPPGTRYDDSFPNCCGTCVPDEPQLCSSSDECDPGEYCTDECFSGCSGDEECPTVCYGACRPTECPPVAQPPYDSCEGEWIQSRGSIYACPQPPICVCPDGSQSLDGQCRDLCEAVDCTVPPVEECPPGQQWTEGYPYCCGRCVDDDFALCRETGGDWRLGCGHSDCKYDVDCQAAVESCGCGPFKSWEEGQGCVDDPACEGSGCSYRGEDYEHGESVDSESGCAVCACVDGEITCTDEVCDPCWGAHTDADGVCLSVEGEEAPSECCGSPSLCTSTGGRWDPLSCGDYSCGKEPMCDAVIPGCDCGEEANFQPGLGCQPSADCVASCTYNGDPYEDGDDWRAEDGCNHCTCSDGEVLCTSIACAP